MGIRLVFMGSATFAQPALRTLFEKGYEISGVITQPDKPSGRGQVVHPPPVKKTAIEIHLPVFQPKSLKNDEAHALLEALAPEMIVVVAYGRILPPWVLQLPRHGCINLHGSILPKYRGAAPVHWAIANGETVTGVCTMLLNEGLDTGPVFLCRETPIGPEETVEQVYGRLSEMGAAVLMETVDGIAKGTLQPHPQDDSQATLAPILKKEDGFIDWSMTASQIHNRVRAFNPWPGTVTKFRGAICKILSTRVTEAPQALEPGTLAFSRRSLTVACGGSSALEILLIQPENRKAVAGADFANGARILAGDKFEPLGDN